jgi:hypothetical protein
VLVAVEVGASTGMMVGVGKGIDVGNGVAVGELVDVGKGVEVCSGIAVGGDVVVAATTWLMLVFSSGGCCSSPIASSGCDWQAVTSNVEMNRPTNRNCRDCDMFASSLAWPDLPGFKNLAGLGKLHTLPLRLR